MRRPVLIYFMVTFTRYFYSAVAAAVAVGYGAYLVLSFDNRLGEVQRNLTTLTQLASQAPRTRASDSARIEILENSMITP